LLTGSVHLKGSVFELQIVHRGISPEVLKRGEPEMAKGKTRAAGPDDPIFTGKFVISSHNKQNPPKPDPDDSLTDEEWEKSRMMSDEELLELGLLDREQLVISSNPTRRKK
jgi:hypothetical protein